KIQGIQGQRTYKCSLLQIFQSVLYNKPSKFITVLRRRTMRRLHPLFCCVIIVLLSAISATAQVQLPPEMRDRIDKLATDVLTRTGVPSASLAIVKDGQVAYVKAYGDARLEPKIPATP